MARKIIWFVSLWAASVVVVGLAAFAMRALIPH
jgi:hypothetical protein